MIKGSKKHKHHCMSKWALYSQKRCEIWNISFLWGSGRQPRTVQMWRFCVS